MVSGLQLRAERKHRQRRGDYERAQLISCQGQGSGGCWPEEKLEKLGTRSLDQKVHRAFPLSALADRLILRDARLVVLSVSNAIIKFVPCHQN